MTLGEGWQTSWLWSGQSDSCALLQGQTCCSEERDGFKRQYSENP